MSARLFVTLWHLLKDFHRRIYRLTVFIVLYEILKLAPAAVLALVIDSLITFQQTDVQYVLILVAVLFVSSMFVSVCDSIISHEGSMIDFESQAFLLQNVAEKLLRLPVGYHEQKNTGSTIHTLHRGVDRLSELIFFATREMLPTLTQLVITTIVLLWVGLIPSIAFIAFLILLWLFLQFAAVVFFIVMTAIYWVLHLALRQVFAHSKACQGDAVHSLGYATLYTGLYTGWLFALLLIVGSWQR